jgi:hypothetical protein
MSIIGISRFVRSISDVVLLVYYYYYLYTQRLLRVPYHTNVVVYVTRLARWMLHFFRFFRMARLDVCVSALTMSDFASLA